MMSRTRFCSCLYCTLDGLPIQKQRNSWLGGFMRSYHGKYIYVLSEERWYNSLTITSFLWIHFIGNFQNFCDFKKLQLKVSKISIKILEYMEISSLRKQGFDELFQNVADIGFDHFIKRRMERKRKCNLLWFTWYFEKTLYKLGGISFL